MVYTPVFTSIAKVSNLVGFTIDGTSEPSETRVLDWIEEVETVMKDDGWSTQALSDLLVDVPRYPPTLPPDTLAKFEALAGGVRYGYIAGVLVIPPFSPIQSVTKMERNLNSYSQDPNWETLTEGPGTNTDFIVLKHRFKSGYYGIVFYFYTNIPSTGYQRLRINYTWGHNIPAKVLSRYAGLKTAVMVLYNRYTRHDPVVELRAAGLLSRIHEFQTQHAWILEEIEKIEDKWIEKDIGVALL